MSTERIADAAGHGGRPQKQPKSVLVDYERLNSDERLVKLITDNLVGFQSFFRQFNEIFEKDSEPVSTVFTVGDGFATDALNGFIRRSAVDFGGINLQHYVVAMHKAMNYDYEPWVYEDEIQPSDFYYVIQTLYADVDDASVKHFALTYHKDVKCAYMNRNHINILNYLRIYDIDGVTPFMNAVEIFDALMCDRFKVTRPDEIWNSSNRSEKEIVDEFKSHFVNICKEYRFLVHSEEQLYALHEEMFFYQTSDLLSVFSNWKRYGILIVSQNFLNSVMSQFYLTMEPFDFISVMTATSVGMFNSITGLYSSRTTLVELYRGQFKKVWPFGRDLVPFPEQNLHILRDRNLVKQVVSKLRNDVDDLFVRFKFIPSIVSLTSQTTIHFLCFNEIQKFFEIVEHHETLPGTLPLLEMFPYNPQLVVFIFKLKKQYGVYKLTDYEELCSALNKTSPTMDDWLEHFERTMKYRYIPEETVTVGKTYAEIITSFDWERHVGTRVTDRDIVLSVTMVVALSRCSAYETMFRAFGYEEYPKPTKYFEKAYLKKYDFELSLGIGNYIEKYNVLIEAMLRPNINETDRKFEKALYVMGLQLCESVSFRPQAVRELLNVCSTLMWYRTKKFYVLHGEQNTDKKHILKIITEMMKPSVHCVDTYKDNWPEKVEKLLLLYKDLNILSPEQLVPKDFMSELPIEGLGGLPAVFATADTLVKFKEAHRCPSVVREVIDKLHVITLTGTKFNKTHSFFSMTALQQTFKDDRKTLEMAHNADALQWLAYENYMTTRHPHNFEPYINAQFEDSLTYKNEMYRENIPVYEILYDCGFIAADGFQIECSTVKRVMSGKFKNLELAMTNSGFEELFYQTNYVDFFKQKLSSKDSIMIWNLQFKSLVEHVKRNMATRNDPGCIIFREDMEQRLEAYVNSIDKKNALRYFEENNEPFVLIQIDNKPENVKFGIRDYNFVSPKPEDVYVNLLLE